ncbi:uncharacterized protein [Periplaneta americana]|uniref:uncharacterized protein isoform X2 n=1 Tax=Periplaneta americana TaxID=6978 RepID=UPI0037E82896
MEPRNAGAGANVNGGYKSLESWNCKIKREPVEVAEDGANTMSEEDDVAAKFLTIEMEPEEMSCAAETTEETKAGAQAKQSTPTKTAGWQEYHPLTHVK